MKKLISYMLLILSPIVTFAREKGIDQQIDEWFGYYTEPFVSFIFASIPITDTVSVPWVLIALVGGALTFTLYFRFVNVRKVREALNTVRGKYDYLEKGGHVEVATNIHSVDGDIPETARVEGEVIGEVTHFQALTASLSATVGLGNIAGVAVAVSVGGPGATFWMIIAGILGMTSKFAECTLGVKYREMGEDGKIYGGPMYYLSKGLASRGLTRFGKVLAVIFSIMCIGGSFGGGNMFQSNQAFNMVESVSQSQVEEEKLQELVGSQVIYSFDHEFSGTIKSVNEESVVLANDQEELEISKENILLGKKIKNKKKLLHTIKGKHFLLKGSDAHPELDNQVVLLEDVKDELVVVEHNGNRLELAKEHFANTAILTNVIVNPSNPMSLESMDDFENLKGEPMAYYFPDKYVGDIESVNDGLVNLNIGDKVVEIKQSSFVSGAVKSPLTGFGAVAGIILAILVGVVIIGGIKSIAKVTDKIVPAMVITYIVAAIAILVMNVSKIPFAFGQIFEGAFTGTGIAGGAIGVLIQGFKRAAFSNEAGVGSASIAHAAVKTSYPASEGLVAMIGPFVDTVVVCTMTALVLIITNTEGDILTYGEQVVGGVSVTSAAFGSVFEFFPYILAVAVVLFAFSSMISWSYYGLQAWSYLFGKTTKVENIYKAIFCLFVIVGAAAQLNSVIEFSDAMIFAMLVPNLTGVILLLPKVNEEFKLYMSKIKKKEQLED